MIKEKRIGSVVKMKNTVLILFGICTLFVTDLKGQEDVSISEVRENKNQVELGFRSVSNIWNNTTSATILFKRKFKTGKLIEVNSINFFRSYFSMNSQVNFTEDPTRQSEDSTMAIFHPGDILNVDLGIGLEKQFQKKRFVHYYGSDLYTRYYKSDDDFPDNLIIGGVSINATISTDRTVRVINSGLIPFFGVKYYLTKQFNVGIESGFGLTYFNTKFQELRTVQEFDPDLGMVVDVFEELPPVVSNGIRFNFLGLRFVTVGYSF